MSTCCRCCWPNRSTNCWKPRSRVGLRRAENLHWDLASAMSKASATNGSAKGKKPGNEKPPRVKVPNEVYEAELFRLQTELVKLQEWVRFSGARLVVIFEGRDGAGKGGTIKRITEYLNPRVARIAALPNPTDRERGGGDYQRYIAPLSTKGEIVRFD